MQVQAVSKRGVLAAVTAALLVFGAASSSAAAKPMPSGTTSATIATDNTVARASRAVAASPVAAKESRAVGSCWVHRVQLLRCPNELGGVVSGYADYFQSENRHNKAHRLGIHVLLSGWVPDLKYLRLHVSITRRVRVGSSTSWVRFASTRKHLRISKVKGDYVRWSILMGWDAPLGKYHIAVRLAIRYHPRRYVYVNGRTSNNVFFDVLRP
jgi:hypothetical protein